MDFMQLAKEWNDSSSQVETDDHDIHNGTILFVGNDENMRTIGLSIQESGAEFQLCNQVTQLETDGADMELAQSLNSQMTWDPVRSAND